MEQHVYDTLEKLGLSYKVIQHPALFKSSDMVTHHIDFGEAICFKNLLLKDGKLEKFYLVSLPIDKRANLKEIQNTLQCSRLSFGTEAELIEKLGVASGSASVLNFIEKPDTEVCFLIDKEILTMEQVCFHPNVNTASVVITPTVLTKLLEQYSIDYQWIKV